MKSLDSKKIGLAAIAACILAVQSVQAEPVAKNRNDVYDALSHINSGTSVSGLDVWINEKSARPAINIGDPIVFTMQSETPAFYTLIYVDSKGGTSVLQPMSASDAKAADHLVYPSASNGDVQFTQAEPIGQDSIYLLASKRAISSEVLGLDANENYRDLGKSMVEIESLVSKINSQAQTNPLSVVRYTYDVESADTQYSTRSIRRKVNELENSATTSVSTESLNFNNINFAFKSDELTSPGKLELDGLGNALVSMQEENGEFPLVELIGHTDAIGSEVYNENLSTLRAESAKRYLVSEHGVPFDQIVTVGAGEMFPLEDNESHAGRALNRRVELKVVAQ